MRDRLLVKNPATLNDIQEITVCDRNDVNSTVEIARKTQPAWAALSFTDRAKCLSRLRKLIICNQDSIIATIQSETAKVTVTAMNETLYTAGAIDFFNNHLFNRIKPHRTKVQLPLFNKLPIITYKPIPVVGMITPWNLPFTLTLGEAIPYLLMGSAVVLKPSEYTPLSSLKAEELCRLAGIPPGIFQVISGYGETGAALVEGDADSIVFTGSARTGRKIAEVCGRLLKPCSLELGGKTPFMILEKNNRRNVKRAIRCAVWSAFDNAGQYCKKTSNVYVHRKHADYVIGEIIKETQQLVAGRDYGPVIPEFQLKIIIDQVEDARSKHALVVTGNTRKELVGRWYQPTVLTDVTFEMKVMTEEIFGPILTISVVENDEEAIGLANNTRYGLNAVVFSSDIEYARSMAPKINAGTITINDALINYIVSSLPYGGVKDSGWGRHHGLEGQLDYAVTQSLLIHRSGLSPFISDVWWFPYDNWKISFLKNLIYANRFFADWFGGY